MNKQAVATSIIALAACAGAARATLIDITQPGTTLQQVLGNQFQVGDKIFSVAANGFNSSVFNANNIFISPVVNNDPIMWTMLNAVKEQQQQIERQQKQIATLMTSNAALNARLRGVEKSLRKNAGSTRRRR